MKNLLLLIILINYSGFLKAQSYLGYYIHHYEYSVYSDLEGGVISSATGDNGAENINLPFNFNYFGIDYSTARISVNGWLELGQTYTGSGNNNDLASTIYKPLICPFWDNLVDDSNSFIKYKTEGISPARIFVVEWNNINAGFSRKNFQVRLNEVDGTIEFKYGPQSDNGYILSASIGMNDHVGGTNHFISITPSYPLIVDTTIANNNITSFEGLSENASILLVPYHKFSVRIVQILDDVIIGSVNQPIVKILITSHFGVLTMPSVISVSFNTNGTTNTNDILNAKLFSTGINPNFSTASQSGSTIINPNGNFIINGGAGLFAHSTNYLWLAYDVSSNAQIGNVLDAECNQLNFSLGYPSVIPIISAPIGNRVIVPGNGLAGIYTVGDSGDFNSLSAIMDSLSETFIIGPLTIELLADYNSQEENFPIVFSFINGISPQNQIVIRPALNAGNINISSIDTAAIIFNAASYFSIDGRPGGIIEEQALSIVNENQNGSTITISGNSKNISIANIKILGCNNSTDKGVVQSVYNDYYSFSENISLNNCFISKSNTGKPAIGIYFGEGDFPVAKNWIIKNCTITDFTDSGIKINRALLTYIEDSDIFLTEPSDKDKVVGIIINPNAFSTRVLRNSIHSLSTTYSTLNYVTGIDVPFADDISVYNNCISLAGNEFSSVTGIDFNGEYYTYDNFYNNSIYIYGSCDNSSNSYCFRRRSTQYYSGLMLKLLNNLLNNERSNLQGTGHHYSIAIDDQRGLQLLDYSNYFVSGNGGVLGRWLNQDISNLADWKVATQKDFFSISKEISFVSEIDLHLNNNSLGDSDLIALPISVIPDDIDQESRNSLYPYRGADENLSYPLPVELISLTANISDGSVLLDWSIVTETNNSGFEIHRKNQNDNDWKTIGFVPGFGTTTEPKTYSFIDSEITNGISKYRLKQIDFDGTFEYSNELEVEFNFTPKEFALEQNFPNPFNPSTKIKYQIPESSFVTLKIYDVLGNEVAKLVNEDKSVGDYEIEFDGTTLTSGIYFYRTTNRQFC